MLGTSTSTVTYVDLSLDDVEAGVRFFRQILALPVREYGPDHAQVRLADDLVVQLRPRTVPAHAGGRPTGPIVQVSVPNVWGAITELRRRGATVLIEPVLTDWGTESAFVAGPGDLVVEIYRSLEG